MLGNIHHYRPEINAQRYAFNRLCTLPLIWCPFFGNLPSEFIQESLQSLCVFIPFKMSCYRTIVSLRSVFLGDGSGFFLRDERPNLETMTRLCRQASIHSIVQVCIKRNPPHDDPVECYTQHSSVNVETTAGKNILCLVIVAIMMWTVEVSRTLPGCNRALPPLGICLSLPDLLFRTCSLSAAFRTQLPPDSTWRIFRTDRCEKLFPSGSQL